MSFLTILILGASLSMDAFAVSICKGLALHKVTWKNMLTAGLWFGIFQGLMPAIGYILGNLIAGKVEAFSSWIAFALLAFIGGNMIRESFAPEEKANDSMKPGEMFMLAIATSIDALAVGVTFSVVPVAMFSHLSTFANTMLACLIICIETCCFSAFGVKLGSIAGAKYENKAKLAGGVVLVLIGLRILLSHYHIL